MTKRCSLNRAIAALSIVLLVEGAWKSSLSAKTSPQEGLELCQKTAAGGEYIVDVTNTSLKIAKRGTPVFLIAKAPDWTINLFNTATKKLYTTPVNNFKGSFANSFYRLRGDDPEKLAWKDIGTENFKGIKASHLVTKREDKEKISGHYSMKEWMGSVRGDVFIVKNFAVPPVIPSIIGKYYGIPRFNGLPLSLTHNKENKTASVGLSTLWVKRTSLKESDFDQPKGFAKAKSEEETVYDSEEIPLF